MSRCNKPFLNYAHHHWPFCQWCEKPLARHEATADHVIPLAVSGDHSWENRVVSCGPCNQDKGDKIVDQEPHGLRWTTPEPTRPTLPAQQIMSLGIIRAICGRAA